MTDMPKTPAPAAIGPGNEDRKHAERRYREVVGKPSPPAQEPAPAHELWCLFSSSGKPEDCDCEPCPIDHSFGRNGGLCCIAEAAERRRGKAEPPPAADPPSWMCDGSHEPPRCTSAACWMDVQTIGMRRAAGPKADESGATREEKCHECSHVHQGVYCNFNMRSHGTHLCRCSATPLPAKAEPQSGIEAGRGEVSEGGQTVEIAQALGDAGLLKDDGIGFDLAPVMEIIAGGLHAAEERLADNAKEIPALREAAGRYRAEKQRAEEARRLAEQERADKDGEIITGFGRQIRVLRAEVERLQGELAGLRKAAEHGLDMLVASGFAGSAIVRDLGAALAPQEGAEKGR